MENKKNDLENQEIHTSPNSVIACEKCQSNPQEKSDYSQEKNYKEKFIRTLADFENFKHRVEKEKINWFKDAQAEIIRKLLPLFDDIERATNVAPKIEDLQLTQAWIDGVIKICNNNEILLKKLGIEEIKTTGEFDPELHEALCQVPATEECTSGKIVQVLRKGYTMHGIVLRHAQVSVAQ